ncbi:DNA sulfur modification protein DndB [Lysobacter korlensis]|uniref:DNA sulfur modification protein DndB n=1 Tax=Lysobacter korlensis TaxID=553636 RepID=A0ABV6S0X0_9GAMM
MEMNNALMFEQTGLSLPALRGLQGGRILYLSLPPNSVMNTFFPIDLEPAQEKSQRALDPRHAREIAEYIKENPAAYALGAVTYALDVEGSFAEAAPGSGIGLLRLPLNAKLRSIDGQHRREGVRLAIDELPSLAGESTAVLMYVEPDLARRRQMFSDMNNTARRVSKAVNISFDSRDPFARVVNELVESHSLLQDRVERTSIRVAPSSGKVFTLGAVHDAVKRLFVGPAGRVKDPHKYAVADIEARSIEFFDLLSEARPELREPPTAEAFQRNILYSSTTLRVVAGAVWNLCYDAGGPRISPATLAPALASIGFSPNESMWLDAGFVSPGRSTPNARSQELAAATAVLTEVLMKKVASAATN